MLGPARAFRIGGRWLPLAAAICVHASVASAEDRQFAQSGGTAGDSAINSLIEALSPQLEERISNLGHKLIDQPVLRGVMPVPTRNAGKGPSVGRDEATENPDGSLVRIPALLRKGVSYTFGGKAGEPVAAITLAGVYRIWPDRVEYLEVVSVSSLTTPRVDAQGRQQISGAPLPPTPAQLRIFQEILNQMGFSPNALDICMKTGEHTVLPRRPISRTKEEEYEAARKGPYAGSIETCQFGPNQPLTARFQTRIEPVAIR